MSDVPAAGICYLVGAGPGDPGLVTLRAKECIEQADVIAYDYLVNPELLQWARPDAEVIYVGKKADQHTLPQEKINALLVERVRQGKTVTRLKGGDPYVFGRGGEEAEELLNAGCAFEVVPGISSAIAGPAYAGIPVTHRAFNSQLTLFTGHEDPGKDGTSLDFAQLAKTGGVKVMLMGVGRIAEWAERLIGHGAAPDTPVALIRWATTDRQETLAGTLETIGGLVAERGFQPPAVCVIGDTVSLRDRLNWFERRPLFGKRIVVTRTRRQAGELTRRLRALGAGVIEIPAIRTEPAPDPAAFGELVVDAHRYDWIIFTSPNGVEAFFSAFFRAYSDARELGGARIAAIGPGTEKKVREYHLSVDFVPSKAVAETFVREFPRVAGSVENQMILWVRPEGARDVVARELTGMGAIVDEAVAYRTVPETEDVTGGQERFRTGGADVLTFASSSAVHHFLDLGLPVPENTRIASIGPVTSDALRERGLPVHIEAARHDVPGLVQAILDYFGR